MNAPRQHSKSYGAALVVGLVLLAILTLLAISGMHTTVLELLMAGNEQYRRAASLAASAGIEEGIAAAGLVPAAPGAVSESGPKSMHESPSDTYSFEVRYEGVETGLPQSSADKYVGLHYAIESQGKSLRLARDQQIQGVLVIAAAATVETTTRQLGSGL